jgi:branched-chain amino acid transport system permease protein
VGGAIVVGVFALPAVVPYDFQADLVSLAAIYAIVGLSMNVLVGYLGQLSLGHQAFFGVGAFASGVVATMWGLPFPVGLAAAAFTGAVSALLLGSISLRVRGLYLAIVTLAYGILTQESIFKVGFLSAGVPADKPSLFSSPRTYAYVVLAVLAILYVVDVRLLKTKAGRAVQAIRDDEKVGASFGIDLTNYKLLAFVVSGAVAPMAPRTITATPTTSTALPTISRW